VTGRSTVTVADLSTQGQWQRFDAPPDLEPGYRAVTGLTGDAPPRGLASVVGRLAYTRGRDMPPGGVLRELSLRTLGPPPADGSYDVRVAANVLGERAGRKRVRVVVSLRRAADGGDVADAGYLLDWPAGAP